MASVVVIGAGWAGLAAAVRAVQAGHQVSVLEAAPQAGGRARSVAVHLPTAHFPDGRSIDLDNGQHILIGAYQQTLELMRSVGVNPDDVLLRLPLDLRGSTGAGLALPDWATPWNAAAGILGASGWSLSAKASLLRHALAWQRLGFACPAAQTVGGLCATLHPQVRRELIEPLCVAALNTPADEASAQVFLRVLQDSLFGPRGSSDLLLPRRALSALLPDAAVRWLRERGMSVALGVRVQQLARQGNHWCVLGKDGTIRQAEEVVLALDAVSASRLMAASEPDAAPALALAMQQWRSLTERLRFEAITTVYAYGTNARLPRPMIALPCDAENPAQFAFDRGQLDGHAGVIALVVSASTGERENLQAQALAQARAQLGLELQALQTITEHRATFACTAELRRPPTRVAPGLRAVGDYVEGPYPATLEGAVRSATRLEEGDNP